MKREWQRVLGAAFVAAVLVIGMALPVLRGAGAEESDSGNDDQHPGFGALGRPDPGI